jgi:hypothetical protein
MSISAKVKLAANERYGLPQMQGCYIKFAANPRLPIDMMTNIITQPRAICTILVLVN